MAFVDRLRRRRSEPVIVLIPVALPDRLRYRFLHNQIDLVLTRALRHRPDVVVARVPVRVHVRGRGGPLPARGMRATMRWRNAGVSQSN